MISFTEAMCEPAFERWKDLVEDHFKVTYSPSIEALRQEMRREVAAAAAAYTAQVGSRAGELRTDRPWVLMGHQPEMIHCGILYKYDLVERLCTDEGAFGLNVIIDSDFGDAGAFPLPEHSDSRQETTVQRELTVATAPGIYGWQTLASAEHLRDVVSTGGQLLRGAGKAAAAEKFNEVMDFYLGQPHSNLRDANTLLRRTITGHTQYLEIPLTTISKLPSVKRWFHLLLSDPERLHGIYNQTLDRFRAERKIKNRANPFPNLTHEGEFVELPFWVLDAGLTRRDPLVFHMSDAWLYIRTRDEGLKREMSLSEWLNDDCHGAILIPRGMLITTLLRVFLGDLFVHGLGGAKYDPCTELFIQAFIGDPPSPYTTATATVRLFEEELREYHRLKQIEHIVERAKTTPGILLEPGSPAAEKCSHYTDRIAELLAQKNALLEGMRVARESGQPVKEFGTRLKVLEKESHSIASEMFAPELQTLKRYTPKVVAALESREYPYFLFC